MSAQHDEVLEANAAFYDAFARGDFAAMERLWAREHPVACIHPGWPPLFGREAVLESWAALLGGGGGPVRPVDPQPALLGAVAFVLCQEDLDGARLVATNLFVREGARWCLCHHQAAPAPFPERPVPPGGYVN
ncbi:MAG: DUF4440 domain-containing protein [Deltaproteobacteria bacterium]|nr:MAG: DUF4440 domain-containing protein [Deltaproteobacteria bacterium]